VLVDPIAALARLGGSADVKALDALCGRRALRRVVRSGEVERLARGRYGLPAGPDPVRSAVRLGGVASYESAATRWGIELPVRADARAQVTVGRGRSHLKPDGVEVHWADVPASDVEGSFTTPLRTLLDLARHRPFGTALAAADCALRMRLVLPGDLMAGAQRLRGPGCTQARRVADHADARAASVLESVLRAIMIEGEITGFEPQVEIHGDRFFARVDLGHRGRRIALEADSFEHHGHRAALARDCRRYTELTTRGWLVLRFAWEQVMFEPDWVVAMIRAALELPRAGTLGSAVGPRCAGGESTGRCACPTDKLGRQKSTVAKAPTSSKPTRR
jgi:very-short-patch-repair endonuclease